MKRVSVFIAGAALVVLNLLYLHVESSEAQSKEAAATRRVRAEQGLSSAARASLRPSSRRGNLANLRFRRLCAQRGSWQGYIVGTGHFRLHLSIIRNGVVESTRLIGRVQRVPGERPISFAFRSAIPPGNSWSWRITAQAI